MADPRELLADKDFQNLSQEAKRKVFGKAFPDFALKSPLAQDQILRGPPASFGERAVGTLKGMGKTALEDLRTFGEAQARGFGVQLPLTPEHRTRLEELEKRRTPSEKAGEFGTRTLEFMGLPEARGTGLIRRALTEAGKTGLVSGVQTHFDPQEMAKSAAVGGAFPVAGRMVAGPMSWATRKVAGGLMDALGYTTGAGREAIEIAATKAGPQFEDAMRNDKTAMDLVNTFREGLQKLVNKKRAAYQAALASLPQKQTMNAVRPTLDNLLQTLRKDWGIPVKREIIKTPVPASTILAPGGGPARASSVKTTLGRWQPDFSQSVLSTNPTEQQRIITLIRTLEDHKDETVVGVDRLKQAVDNLYNESSRARPMIQSTKVALRDMLNKIPGYQQMTQDYAAATDLQEQVERELSLSPSANPGTAVRKLIPYALNQNNKYRSQLIDLLADAVGMDLKGPMAGFALQEALPRGLVGRGIFGAELWRNILGGPHRAAFAMLLSSPRFVGESLALLHQLTTNPQVRALISAGGTAAGGLGGLTRGAGLAAMQNPPPQ